MNVIVFPDGRISRKEAAKYIGIPPSTLRTWNSLGKHDEFFQKIVVANKVFYDFEKVKQFCVGQ